MQQCPLLTRGDSEKKDENDVFDNFNRKKGRFSLAVKRQLKMSSAT